MRIGGSFLCRQPVAQPGTSPGLPLPPGKAAARGRSKFECSIALEEGGDLADETGEYVLATEFVILAEGERRSSLVEDMHCPARRIDDPEEARAGLQEIDPPGLNLL